MRRREFIGLLGGGGDRSVGRVAGAGAGAGENSAHWLFLERFS